MSTFVSHRSSRDPAPRSVGSFHLNCPRCGLTITPRAAWLTVEHCPRCMARSRVAVGLFASPLPTGKLYAADAAPCSDPQCSPQAADRRTRWRA